MEIPSTLTTVATIDSPKPRLASRRHWLKGLGALLGTGMLATPTALLAAPAAAAAPLPASDLVGAEEYIGMVKLLTAREVPQGWALCDGRELSVSQHPALFTLLGRVYGRNKNSSTFALPDLTEVLGYKSAQAATGIAAPQPNCIAVIKITNAPATTAPGTELRLRHHHRPRIIQHA
jgi:hypothetical protein